MCILNDINQDYSYIQILRLVRGSSFSVSVAHFIALFSLGPSYFHLQYKEEKLKTWSKQKKHIQIYKQALSGWYLTHLTNLVRCIYSIGVCGIILLFSIRQQLVEVVHGAGQDPESVSHKIWSSYQHKNCSALLFHMILLWKYSVHWVNTISRKQLIERYDGKCTLDTVPKTSSSYCATKLCITLQMWMVK